MRKFYFFSVFLALIFIVISCNKVINDPNVLIEKYLTSKSLQQRISFVYDTANAKAVMENYYQSTDFSKPIKFSNIKKVDNPSLPDSVQLISVVITGKNAFGSDVSDISEYYVVKLKDEGLKIDWLSSLGFNKISLKSFQAIRPSDIGIFRFDCKLSDYYNYGYADFQNKYYSIDCNSEFDESTIYAYVDKTSDEGKKMFEILKDGKNHKLVLAVKYDYKSENSTDIVALKKLVATSWYYNEKSKISIPESLQDYVLYSNLDTTFIFEMTNGSPQSDPITSRVKYSFDRSEFIINTAWWFQGREASNNTEYCNLDDNILEVTRVEGHNVLTGRFDNKSYKLLVKLPAENKPTEWNYKTSEGFTISCSSEFVEVDFKGQKIKAIKVTERNSHIKDIVFYRIYMKGFGLYEESSISKDGSKVYSKRLIP